jgi:hypothetical protein
MRASPHRRSANKAQGFYRCAGIRVRVRETTVNDLDARVMATYKPSTEKWLGSHRTMA